MNISVIIPTRGSEREAFIKHLTGHLLPYQTRQPDEVILIDHEPIKEGSDQGERLAEGMSKAKGDLVLIIEDDDWYASNYIEEISSYWEQFKEPHLIGYAETLYYNIRRKRYRKMHHPGRSSLFSTGVSQYIAKKFRWDNAGKYIDIKLWNTFKGDTLSHGFQYSAIGIKHGIGLTGGNGHDDNFMNNLDENGIILQSCVDVPSYEFYKSL